MTISSTLKWWSHEIPDQHAIRIGDDSLTYAELDTWVSGVADYLVEQGIEPGDRVGTIAGTSLAHVALLLGIVRAGAIANPINSRLSEHEVRAFYEKTMPRLVFMDSDQSAKQSAIESVGASVQPMDGLLAVRGAESPRSMPDLDPDGPVCIIATSGSTATPKGVIFTHRSMLSYAAEFSLEEPFQGPGSRSLALSPLSTSAGFVLLVQFTAMGSTLYLQTGFDPEAALHTLETEKINVFQGVPLFFESIAALPRFADADLSHLHVTTVGGARVSRKLLETWREKGCLLRQIYGQTEAGGSSTIMSKRDAARFPEKAGRGGLFTEIRTIDDDGNFLGPDEPGQIVIRGPALMKGYWNDPENTAKTIVDGWLRTGDIGAVDAEGYLTFMDRMKDIIISGGLNVSAAEVERTVAEFAGVLEVAVIGAPDEKFGETPLAIIHATESIDIAALNAHCDKHLANYKVPRYVVVQAEPLPRLATGKIAKPALRERVLPTVPELTRIR